MAVTRVRPGTTAKPPKPSIFSQVAAGKKPIGAGVKPAVSSAVPNADVMQKAQIMKQSFAPGAGGGTTTTTMEFKPDASWWSKQFGGHELYRQNMPILRSKEEGAAASYGYRIMRNAAGQPIFKSKGTGATGITQALDEKGNPLVVLNEVGRPVYQYKDSEGKLYAPEDLEMDIQRIQKGEAGYLEGALGAAEAGSEKRQFDIGDVAAQRTGVRRSGMRASAASMESQALQDALAGLTRKAAGEFGDIQGQYRDLYNQIYGDLLKSAAATPGTEVTTTTGGGEAGGGAAGTTIPGGDFGTPVTVGPNKTLSPGPSGEFMKLMNNITVASGGHGGTGYNEIVKMLGKVKQDYSLTPQQIRWIDDWIKTHKAEKPDSVNVVKKPPKKKK